MINIEDFIQQELTKLLPKHQLSEGYHYAMFPAGKLFRPNIALNILQDLNPKKYKAMTTKEDLDILYFACALETHHGYTLVHDDLPSMDNDDFRRGRPSTHKKYGEWQAILIGDGLLNNSYEFLFRIKNCDLDRYRELLKVFSYATGPRGLILGQVLDLSQEMTLSFENTIRTHKLKTARLIQLAMLGATFIAKSKNRKLEKRIWRFGENIGIVFQLLDDLSELSEIELSKHENEVNPWPKFSLKTYEETVFRLNQISMVQKEIDLPNTYKMLSSYFIKMNEQFKSNKKIIENHLENKIDLDPVISILDRLGLF